VSFGLNDGGSAGIPPPSVAGGKNNATEKGETGETVLNWIDRRGINAKKPSRSKFKRDRAIFAHSAAPGVFTVRDDSLSLFISAAPPPHPLSPAKPELSDGRKNTVTRDDGRDNKRHTRRARVNGALELLIRIMVNVNTAPRSFRTDSPRIDRKNRGRKGARRERGGARSARSDASAMIRALGDDENLRDRRSFMPR